MNSLKILCKIICCFFYIGVDIGSLGDIDDGSEKKRRSVTQELWGKSEAFQILNDMGLITDDEMKTKYLKSGEIRCGPVPEDSTHACHPNEAPCLFNIRKDPCESYNLAPDEPDILQDLMQRLATHRATAVPPRNQPPDPNANPEKFGGVWSSWRD